MDSFVNVENAFQGDMKEFINNLKDEDYRIYIQKKYDIILESFKKIYKNKDSFIDYDELISFLDDCMGVKFCYQNSKERNLIKKQLIR